MRTVRVRPGAPLPDELVGSILTRDLVVGGARWSKGRRLDAADLSMLAAVGEEGRVGATAQAPGRRGRRDSVTLLVIEAGDLHEDEAAARLALALAGENLRPRGPVQSRIDLLASVSGVVRVRVAALERLNRIDPIEVFTVLDGQVVAPGDLVASIKVAPHVVPLAVVERAEALIRRHGPPVTLAALLDRKVGVVVSETVPIAARARFESTVRARIEGLGSHVASIAYVADDPDEVAAALAAMTTGSSAVDLILTAGAASTDPEDAFFVALDRLGGRVVRRGVPAHPGSMLWLGRLRGAAVLGLPTCGAYSKATAADLLLPRLLAGEPASVATVARLGHGGVLSREMRFRFPAYARELEAPDG